jgi:pimeloyl-ACP methyl ester carboxylesterase
VLAETGWRVVAPFMRGYAPSSLASDGSYQVWALMDNALRVLHAAGPTGRDVLMGHDWGARRAPGWPRCPPARSTRPYSCRLSAPKLPTLHLYGTEDGAVTADYTRWVEPVLPEGGRVELVEGDGHFLQLERPDVVAGHILDFVGR